MKGFITNKTPYFFITPAIILLSLFSIIPIFVAIGISFTDIDLAGLADWSTVSFVGLENYQTIIKDEIFLKSIKAHTLSIS